MDKIVRAAGEANIIHPARLVGYEELRAALVAERGAGAVAVNALGDLELYTYTNRCVYERMWNQWSLMARGLILDTAERAVVATPFTKFFNYGENGVTLPDEPFSVTEKVDGSLGILFHHAGEWRVATKGSLKSSQAEWARAWLHRHAMHSYLEEGTTYLVEIVYPENRIVVSYDFAGLVALAAYNAEGCELTRDELAEEAGPAGLRLVNSHDYDTLESLLTVARDLSGDREGFVVRFASGLRVKIKGAEYCRIHRLVSRCTPLGVWEAMVEGDDLAALRRQLPEEFGRDFDRIAGLLSAAGTALVGGVARVYEETKNMTDKELGLAIGSYGDAGRFVFAARKHGFLDAVRRPGAARRKLFNQFRPTGNRLVGYEPSSAMNRFEQEAT